MKFSIIYPTYRPGSFDMLVDGLKNQTHQDYELIIVDDFKEDRMQLIDDYMVENGIETRFIGRSKPKCFPKTTYNLINAWNTGILASTGDIILIMGDYTWFPPTQLESFAGHRTNFKHNWCISAVADMYQHIPPGIIGDMTNPISIWNTDWKGSMKDNGFSDNNTWIGSPFELFCSAIPYSVLLETNGFSEWWDNCLDQVSPFVKAAHDICEGFYVDQNIICEMVDHKQFTPKSLWSVTESGKKNNTNCFDLKTHIRGNTWWKS